MLTPDQVTTDYIIQQMYPGSTPVYDDNGGFDGIVTADGNRVRDPLGNDFDLTQAQQQYSNQSAQNEGLIPINVASIKQGLDYYGLTPEQWAASYYEPGQVAGQNGDTIYYKKNDGTTAADSPWSFNLAKDDPVGAMLPGLILGGLGAPIAGALGGGLLGGIGAGSAIGAAGSALMGGDPLKGALGGAVGGGLGAGLPQVGITDPTIAGAIRGGATSLAVGGDPLLGAATGAASGAASSALSSAPPAGLAYTVQDPNASDQSAFDVNVTPAGPLDPNQSLPSWALAPSTDTASGTMMADNVLPSWLSPDALPSIMTTQPTAFDTSFNPFGTPNFGDFSYLDNILNPTLQSAPGTINPAYDTTASGASANPLTAAAGVLGKLLFGSGGAGSAVSGLGGQNGLIGSLFGGGNGALLGALAGGLLGSQTQAKQSGTITQVNDVPEWMKPYYQNLYNQAQQLTSNNGLNPSEQGAIDAINKTASAGSPVLQAAEGNLQKTINGDYLSPDSNPYLAATFDRAASQIKNNLIPSAGFTQAFGGSSGFQQAYGRSLSDLATSLYGGQYQQERQNQMAATSAVPSFTSADFTAPMAQLQAGQYARSVPQNNVQLMGGILNGSPFKSSSQPYFTNPTAGALGGALTGGLLGKMF